MIELNHVFFGYSGNGILHDVSVKFGAGGFTALLGPNGAGKSTLLRICGGELAPEKGSAQLEGREIRSWRAKALAQRRAFLPQDSFLEFPFSVEEVAMLGRAPHLRRSETTEDIAIVRSALQLTGMESFSKRDYTSLSGGERQRVQMARVLAQTWAKTGCALLLDEPVANLDPAYQHETLALARDWARAGACVIAILHDINLALRYADDAVVLDKGSVAACGPVREVLTPGLVECVFRVKASLCQDAGNGPFIVTSGVRA